MTPEAKTDERVILGPDSRPARRSKSDRCPRCGETADKRTKSGMADPHPVCVCGYEFFDEVWRG
jgi:hypothetical protein